MQDLKKILYIFKSYSFINKMSKSNLKHKSNAICPDFVIFAKILFDHLTTLPQAEEQMLSTHTISKLLFVNIRQNYIRLAFWCHFYSILGCSNEGKKFCNISPCMYWVLWCAQNSFILSYNIIRTKVTMPSDTSLYCNALTWKRSAVTWKPT